MAARTVRHPHPWPRVLIVVTFPSGPVIVVIRRIVA
jgi:hypothetical protein